MDQNRHLDFYGGRIFSFLPIASFIVGAIYVATTMADPTIQGMWVGILVGIIAAFLLVKDKLSFGESIIDGMADRIALNPVACWIFAGIFATVLRSSGMVNGILWAAYHTGATDTVFLIITFLACAAFATAAGTAFGTITAGMGVLYPAGVLLGAHPALLAGAIIGGGAFGDNLAPISDTTISSASSQGADVGGVVRSRLKYSIASAVLTLIFMVIAGTFLKGSQAEIPYEAIADKMNPMGLIMFIPAFATIFIAIKKGNIVYATTIGIVLGAVLAIIFGLNTFDGIFSVKDGALVSGVAGWMADLSILVILLVAGIRIMHDGGGSQMLLDGFGKLIKTAKGFEISTAVLELIISALMSINAPAILAVGLSFAKPLGEKFRIHPYRRANILDAMACTFVYTMPWSAALLLASGLTKSAHEAFPQVPFISPMTMVPYVLYSWMLFIVMFYAIFSGWGRTYMDDTPQEPETVK